MSGGPDRAHVRLAELVAALSLGIDLGFGQPMEHVLRQCLIALRLAERIGLDEEERAVVYYTALLVNVGCHSDAHEQAKWFGDDIALKAIKYDHELRSVRDGGRRACGCIGAGQPAAAPLPDRARVRALRPPRGRRHDRAPRRAWRATLGEQLGLPDDGARRARRGLRAVGRAAAGRASSRASDDPARGADRAARRVRRGRAPRRRRRRRRRELARERSGKQFDPALADARRAPTPRRSSPASTTSATWDAVIDAEPALAVVLSGERFDAALLAIANFVDLKSPYMLGHCARRRRPRRARRARGSGSPRARCATLRRAGLVHDFGRLGVSNAIWDKRGPLGAGEWERVRLHPYLTERMLHQSDGARAARRDRRPAPRAPRRLGLPARARRARRSRAPARILGAADAYQAMREPRPAPAGALGRRGGRRAARRGRGPAASTPTRSRPCSAPPATACRGAARARPGLTAARGRGAAAARARAVEQGDRRSGS